MRKLFVSSLAVASLLLTQVAYAHPGHDHDDHAVTDVVNRTVEGTTRAVEKVTDSKLANEAAETPKKLKERMVSQREQIISKKSEMLEKIKQDNAQRKQKLEGRRLAQCHNRQDAINTLINASSANSRELLAKIQRVEEGVHSYYASNRLMHNEYVSIAQVVNEKEAFAIASIDVIASQKFDCDTIDASNTPATVKSAHSTRLEALKAYRDSVKQLVGVVKSAAKEAN